MELRYCEICGVAIAPREDAPGSSERAICDRCFQSRRVLIPPSVGDVEDSSGESVGTDDPNGVVRFSCCYCEIELQLRPVDARTPVKCPRCGEMFVLTPEGRAEPSSGRNAAGWLVGGAAEQESSDGLESDQDNVQVLIDSAASTSTPVSSSDTTVVNRSRAEHDLDELTPRVYDFLSEVPERSSSSPDILIDDSESGETGLEPDSDDLPSALTGLTQDVDGPDGLISDDLDHLDSAPSSSDAVLRPDHHSQSSSRSSRDGAGATSRGDRDARGQKRQASGRSAKRSPSQRRAGGQRSQAEGSGSGRLAAESAAALERSKREALQRRAVGLGLVMVVAPVLVVMPFLITTLRGRGFAVRGPMGEALAGMGQAIARGAQRLDARFLDGQVFPGDPLPRAAGDPEPPAEDGGDQGD